MKGHKGRGQQFPSVKRPSPAMLRAGLKFGHPRPGGRPEAGEVFDIDRVAKELRLSGGPVKKEEEPR